MYVNLAYATVDAAAAGGPFADLERQRRALDTVEGFINGMWLEPLDGTTLVLTFWRDERSARAAAPAVGSSPSPGTTITSVETRRVVSSVLS